MSIWTSNNVWSVLPLSPRQVFLAEYAGPLVVYLLFYPRPSLIYGEEASKAPVALAVQ